MLYIIGHFHCQKKMIKRTHMGCIDQKLAFKHQTWTDQANRKNLYWLVECRHLGASWSMSLLFFPKATINPSLVHDLSTCSPPTFLMFEDFLYDFPYGFPYVFPWFSSFPMIFHMFSHAFRLVPRLWRWDAPIACGSEIVHFWFIFWLPQVIFFLLPWVSDVFAWQVQHFKACSLVAVRLRWPFLDRLWR